MARDPRRIASILDHIQILWEEEPDQRLGQFLGNYIFPEMRQTAAWEVEDEEVARRLAKLLKDTDG